MPIHDDVLRAAQRLCRERGERTFSAEDVVRALPHLNENSVRTHIVSRCCVNAPRNHPHRWAYFRRVARGLYEILPALRRARAPARSTDPTRGQSPPGVAERTAAYGRRAAVAPRDTVHAVV